MSDSLPRSEHYTFERIAEGVTFGQARREGTGLSNTALLDLGSVTLVFDTRLTLRSAREIRRAAVASTPHAPALCVNSHWHLDHVGGNPEFAQGPIYSTGRTRAILLEKRAEIEEELTPARLNSDILQLEEQERTSPTPAARAVPASALGLNRALLAEARERRLTLPTRTFDGSLELPGDRDARLVTFGSGHTESDAILVLPREHIVFAGDRVVAGTHPNLASGDPEHWIEVLDRISALRPERIVTGHGPLGTTETLATMREYLLTVLALAREPGTPAIPDRFRPWTEPDQFAGNIARARERYAARDAGAAHGPTCGGRPRSPALPLPPPPGGVNSRARLAPAWAGNSRRAGTAAPRLDAVRGRRRRTPAWNATTTVSGGCRPTTTGGTSSSCFSKGRRPG